MRKQFILIGILGGLSMSTVAFAQDSLYSRLLQFTRDEHSMEKAEVIVERFVTKVYPRKFLPLFQDSDVDLSLAGSNEVCRTDDPLNDPMEQFECPNFRTLAVRLVEKQAWLRQVVRDLQLSASSYEMGIDNYHGRIVRLQTRLPSIVQLWQGDTDIVQSPIAETKVRGYVYESNMTPLFNAVESELTGLYDDTADKKDRERFVAAVWRYRHGFKQVQQLSGGCGNDKLGNGTELQFLSARFCTLEQKLEDVYNQVQTIIFDPPLKPHEMVMFPVKIFDDLQVYVWVRLDDVGLMWDVHLDPVLPSLDCSSSRSYAQPNPPCQNEAILGGTYPNPPDDPPEGIGLCSHPFAKRGYLCRPPETIRCPAPQGSTANPDDIHLVGCKAPIMEPPYRWTEAGPNICNEGGWRAETQGLKNGTDTPDRDPDLEPDQCSRCYVDTFCGQCGGQEGLTKRKELDGRIEVCLNAQDPAMSTYLYIHELVHAQQQCDGPSGSNIFRDEIVGSADGCCATEYQAYLVQCDALGEDGVLSEVGITIQMCAAALSNLSCGGGSSCVELPPGTDSNQVYRDIADYVQANAADLGVAISCEDAVTNPDARVKKQLNSLPQVCSPTCETMYRNTIGNNACMIGQCVEESFERHRLIPGRMPITVQDEAFPWDSDSAEDPNYGEFLMLAPQLSMPLPPYRPALLARQMDNFFCQLNGLPMRIPPVLCSFDPLRQLRSPTKGFGDFWEGLADQPYENESVRNLFEETASGIGTRVGIGLYRHYFDPALSALENIIQSASDLLRNMEDTEFPDEMCRRNANNS